MDGSGIPNMGNEWITPCMQCEGWGRLNICRELIQPLLDFADSIGNDGLDVLKSDYGVEIVRNEHVRGATYKCSWCGGRGWVPTKELEEVLIMLGYK